jgi:hypothetical protein
VVPSLTKSAIVSATAWLAALLVLSSCGGSSDQPSVDPRVAERQNYHQKQYDAGIANPWPIDRSDERVGGYLETSWHAPGAEAATFTIYSRTGDETGSPAATANVALVQTRKLPDYREGGVKAERLRETPAVRWSFDLGEIEYVEHFFEECGIDFIVREAAPPERWKALSPFFEEMSEMVSAKCDD